MLKKLFTAFCLIMLPFLGLAKDYQEGTHYVVVEGKSAVKNEVREYFSFYCPHCYRFEGFVQAIEPKLPEGITLVQNHVDFLRGASPKMQQLLTRTLIVAEKLDAKEKVKEAIFNYIHISRATITSVKDVRNIVVLAGVDGDKFDALIDSEDVVAQANQMKDFQDTLSKTGGITGVPAVVVNGKYRIVNSGLDKENFMQDYINLVEYLTQL
ncbi:thiol:disulfide interchange protein DsbA/DsbL [Thalassotalea ganghwensis]